MRWNPESSPRECLAGLVDYAPLPSASAVSGHCCIALSPMRRFFKHNVLQKLSCLHYFTAGKVKLYCILFLLFLTRYTTITNTTLDFCLKKADLFSENLWQFLEQDFYSAVSRTLFSYENLVSTAREFSRKCETLRCENSMLAITSLNYGMSIHNLPALTH